jgi:hypothetical protein
VHDALQCRLTTRPAENIRIIRVPHAEIRGVKHYCIGDAVQLDGYAGTGVGYLWMRNGHPIGAFAYHPSLYDPGLLVGIDTYQLILRVYDTTSGTFCFDTSGLYIINIYGLPAAPAVTGPLVLDCGTYHLQLIASESVSGTYNWMDGTYGSINDIYSGGPYRVWFTDLHGCINHTDTYVPLAPDTYFPYFPTGCYDFCKNQFPLNLVGPPCVSFDTSAWLYGDSVAEGSGFGEMDPYAVKGPGLYSWVIGNGLCTMTSGIMYIDKITCDGCQSKLDAKFTCTPGDPASYTVDISFSGSPGSIYTLGTDIGPISPFSGILSGGSFSGTLTFTTLYFTPVPDSVTVELTLVDKNGNKCVDLIRIPLPPCNWIEERDGHTKEQAENGKHEGNAMLVFPNPSSGEVTISYDYGNKAMDSRILSVFDMMGRKINQITPPINKGSWLLNTSDWVSGIYIIRMEGDGNALQTQRVIIMH